MRAAYLVVVAVATAAAVIGVANGSILMAVAFGVMAVGFAVIAARTPAGAKRPDEVKASRTGSPAERP